MKQSDLAYLLKTGEYDHIDLGCGKGGSLSFGQGALGGNRGFGIDLDPAKVSLSRDAGFDACVADATNLALHPKSIRFVTMIDFLEHLPSVNDAKRTIQAACAAATDFVFIRQPWFDADSYLFSLGLKLYWSDWTGHPNAMTSLEFYRVVSSIPEVQSWWLFGCDPIEDSNNSAVHPLSSNADQGEWNPEKHPPKNIVSFDQPVYRQIMCVISLKENIASKHLVRQMGRRKQIFHMKKDKIYSVGPMLTGLNNQKMIIAGLFIKASRDGAKVKLPESMIDFTPVPNSTPDSHGKIPIWDIFDQKLFLSSELTNFLSDSPATQIFDMHECFQVAKKSLNLNVKQSNQEERNISITALLNLRASKEIENISNDILRWLNDKKVSALQLRIERDWYEYLLKRSVTKELGLEDDKVSEDVALIFRKIRNTKQLDDIFSIWACCDEDDLTIDKDEIKEIGKLYHLDILFKTDLPKNIVLPKSRLKRSMVDYAICLGLDNYIGLSRSTFSNTLWNMVEGDDNNISCHYLYDIDDEKLTMRNSSQKIPPFASASSDLQEL